jgi:hypothetical protein
MLEEEVPREAPHIMGLPLSALALKEVAEPRKKQLPSFSLSQGALARLGTNVCT